jgi:hypothetical protein
MLLSDEFAGISTIDAHRHATSHQLALDRLFVLLSDLWRADGEPAPGTEGA